MDASRKVVFMDKELEKLTVYVDGPAQIPDILAKVPTKSGRDVWLILHIEIQGAEGGDLPERMFFYNSSLRVVHLKKLSDVTDVISFALLTAKRPRGEDGLYRRESYRNKLIYEYPSLKLWELDSVELEAGDNPFDWALYAGKCALEGGRNEKLKLDYLKFLIEKLDSVGWTHEEKLSLFRFMDTLLHPKNVQLQKEYDAFNEQRQREGKSMLLSAYEERVMEKSRKEGIKEGEKRGEKKRTLAIAAKMLAEGEPREKILNYTGITSKELDKLIKDRAN
ncbi:MAG: hypothetical protein ACOX5A_06535 [Aminivibrio sp.]|jgi:hypothetical protein